MDARLYEPTAVGCGWVKRGMGVEVQLEMHRARGSVGSSTRGDPIPMSEDKRNVDPRIFEVRRGMLNQVEFRTRSDRTSLFELWSKDEEPALTTALLCAK